MMTVTNLLLRTCSLTLLAELFLLNWTNRIPNSKFSKSITNVVFSTLTSALTISLMKSLLIFSSKFKTTPTKLWVFCQDACSTSLIWLNSLHVPSRMSTLPLLARGQVIVIKQIASTTYLDLWLKHSHSLQTNSLTPIPSKLSYFSLSMELNNSSKLWLTTSTSSTRWPSYFTALYRAPTTPIYVSFKNWATSSQSATERSFPPSWRAFSFLKLRIPYQTSFITSILNMLEEVSMKVHP